MAIVFSAVCAVALVTLLFAERAESLTGKLLAKPVASAAFIAVGAVLADGFTGYPRWILIGLVLGAAGDVALIFRRGFVAGLALFLLGHVAYVIACATVVPPGEWVSYVAAAPVLAGTGALLWLWPTLGKLRIPVILYVAAICAMVIGALAVGDTVLSAGALLFFVSDLAVARNRFVAPGFVNRAWGLPAYYAGQLLFAWTLS